MSLANRIMRRLRSAMAVAEHNETDCPRIEPVTPPAPAAEPKRIVPPKIEVVIVSHPKCGRTWLAVMLSRALNRIYDLGMGNQFSLIEITRAVHMQRDKDIKVAAFDHDSSCFRRAHRFSYLKHDNKKGFVKNHVVLLVRDPRDVLVSSFHQVVDRDKNAHEVVPDISNYIRDDVYGIRKLLAFYESWNRNREAPASFTLIRYEDMHRDPGHALRTVLNVMGLDDVSEDVIEEAVGSSTFDKMQKMERESFYSAGAMAFVGEGNVNAMKARKGRIGSYAEELSPEDVAYLDAAIRRYGCPFYDEKELFPA